MISAHYSHVGLLNSAKLEAQTLELTGVLLWSERESSLPEYITAHSLNLKLQMLCSPALTDHGVRTQANPKNSSMFLTGWALIILCPFAMLVLVQMTSCAPGYLSFPHCHRYTEPETGWRTNWAKNCCKWMQHSVVKHQRLAMRVFITYYTW